MPRSLCVHCGSHAQGERCPKRGGRSDRAKGGPYDNDWYRLRAHQIAVSPRCIRCGTTERLEGDHVVPVARGGKSVAANVQTMCRSCNASKGAS